MPCCERNYNLIELGPKGTGKSHIYSEFSPHGILISGGEVSVVKFFVNNANGRIGLVGYWDVVAFDEFAGKKKRADKALVDILKNYMANKSFSRGIETLGAEASMTFVGNTQHTLPYMLKHTDLFDDLPEQYHDSAFLDRLHFYIPGWEVDIIRGEMFSNGYGFVVDYLAEILRNLRNEDYLHLYREHFELSSDLSDRNRTGVQRTFSSLMKILYPHREATADAIEELLRFAIEGRRRVKDQLMRIDPTYAAVHFGYRTKSGGESSVKTLEEELHPRYYNGSAGDETAPVETAPAETAPVGLPALFDAPVFTSTVVNTVVDNGPQEGHLTFQEHQRGVTYDRLFGPYLQGARRIVVTDAYIRLFYQARNFMDFLETIARQKAEDEEIAVHLVTAEDEFTGDQQRSYLEQMQVAAGAIGIALTWEFDSSNTIHARHIVTDHGWKILLDRATPSF